MTRPTPLTSPQLRDSTATLAHEIAPRLLNVRNGHLGLYVVVLGEQLRCAGQRRARASVLRGAHVRARPWKERGLKGVRRRARIRDARCAHRRDVYAHSPLVARPKLQQRCMLAHAPVLIRSNNVRVGGGALIENRAQPEAAHKPNQNARCKRGARRTRVEPRYVLRYVHLDRLWRKRDTFGRSALGEPLPRDGHRRLHRCDACVGVRLRR
eukprot:5996935-Pleurochrysis_carterae.AAC.1